VEKIAPAGVDVDVRLIHSGDPSLIRVDNPYIKAATSALHEVWGKDTVFIRSGGSIPIVATSTAPGRTQRHDGLRPADDNIHAPTRSSFENFELGIVSLIRFLEEVGR